MITSTIEDVMKEIEEQGFYNSGRSSDTISQALRDKVFKGELVTLEELGIKFMDESFFYLLPGNPKNVKVVQETPYSFKLEATPQP